MDKQTLLSSITSLSSQELITKEEIVGAFESGRQKRSNLLSRELGLSEVLYFIGGFIVFIGVAVLIWQNWGSLSSIARILATLGIGIVAYIVGVLLSHEEKFGAAGYAFHLIAALVLPLGIGVLLDQNGYNPTNIGTQSFISGVLLVMYVASYLIFQKPLFTIFSIAYSTWFFFAFTSFLIGPNPFFASIKFFEYRSLFVGLSYLLVGYYFSSTIQRSLSGLLYFLGNLFFLSASFALGGWKPSQNLFWELIFPLIISAGLFLSIKLKSKSFFILGTLFLMAYILKITGEYFSGTLGWPLSLMISGVILIVIGFFAFRFNKKYLSAPSTLQAQT